MELKYSISNLIFLFLLAGCSSIPIDVSSNFDKNINFDSYTTYRWHEGNEYNMASIRYLSDEMIDSHIRSTVERVLGHKNINLQPTGPVDFHVNYSVSSDVQVDIETYNSYAGYAPGWYFGYDASGPYRISGPENAFDNRIKETVINQYSRGTLVLDIVHPETNLLLWRGTAEGKLDQALNQNERIQTIDEAVSRLLSSFPPTNK